MSYLMVKNPFLPDSYGVDYDSPRFRTYGFNTAFSRSSPNHFRNAGAGLPKWLNFKHTNGGIPENHTGETTTSTKSETKHKTPPPYLRKDSNNSLNSKSSKSVNSGSSLRKKVEEHEMKTKTEEWKKNREYRKVRERRKSSKKQINPKLRLIRRFYVPTAIIIALGTIFIFGSTIHSLGDGTVFWTYKETFQVVGLCTLFTGVIMLMITVGVESKSSEKWKKQLVPEVDPFLHPDFLKERKNTDKRKHEDKSSVQSPALDYHGVFKDIASNNEQAFLCSSIQSVSSSAISRAGLTESFVSQKSLLTNGNTEETCSFSWSFGRSAFTVPSSNHASSNNHVSSSNHASSNNHVQLYNHMSPDNHVPVLLYNNVSSNNNVLPDDHVPPAQCDVELNDQVVSYHRNELEVANEDEEERFLNTSLHSVESLIS